MNKQYIFPDAVGVFVTWRCCKCKNRIDTRFTIDEIQIEGGCMGHAPDEYCYCGATELNIYTKCMECKDKIVLRLS
jgi:hypothetical protein